MEGTGVNMEPGVRFWVSLLRWLLFGRLIGREGRNWVEERGCKRTAEQALWSQCVDRTCEFWSRWESEKRDSTWSEWGAPKFCCTIWRFRREKTCQYSFSSNISERLVSNLAILVDKNFTVTSVHFSSDYPTRFVAYRTLVVTRSPSRRLLRFAFRQISHSSQDEQDSKHEMKIE